MRVIVLLLTVVMMTVAMGQVACASPDLVSAVDEAPDVDAPVMPEPTAMVVPERPGPIRIEAPPAPAHGRMHAVLVFRPPRLLASR